MRERERERCLIGCEPGAAFFFPQANHTPRRNKKRESEMHIISIWNRSAGKGTFTTPSFSFSIQLDISDYIWRERTNKRAAAAHHGKCQTLMLSASHGGKQKSKTTSLLVGGGVLCDLYTIDISGNRYTPHSVHNRQDPVREKLPLPSISPSKDS